MTTAFIKMQSKIIEKATSDDAFRKTLLENPNKALAEILEVDEEKLKGLTIHIHVSKPTEWNFAIPPEEISEKELKDIAGGIYSLSMFAEEAIKVTDML